MRKTLLTGVLFITLTATVVNALGEVDSDFMTEMEDRSKSLTSNLSLKDGKAATEDAKAIETMFNEVEAFFVKKGDAQDGVTWSQESRALAGKIAQSVAGGDFDGAAQTAVSLNKTCKACHKIYKTKN